MDKETTFELFKAPACQDVNDRLMEDEEVSAVVAVPEGIRLVSTESFYPGRLRRRGVAKTSSLESFRDFVSRHAVPDILVTVEEKEMRVVAYIDYSTANGAPGHCGFQVVYLPTVTADFAEFNKCKNLRMSQQDFAEFFEDNLDLLQADDSDGMKITQLEAITGIRNFTVKTDSSSSSEVQPLISKQTSIDKLDAKSANGLLPSIFRFSCIPYVGFTPRTYVCRVRVHLAEKKAPEFSYKIIGFEKHVEETGLELVDRVTTSLDDLATIFFGTFNPNPNFI